MTNHEDASQVKITTMEQLVQRLRQMGNRSLKTVEVQFTNGTSKIIAGSTAQEALQIIEGESGMNDKIRSVNIK